jgi:hypothetical protein
MLSALLTPPPSAGISYSLPAEARSGVPCCTTVATLKVLNDKREVVVVVKVLVSSDSCFIVASNDPRLSIPAAVANVVGVWCWM